MIRSGQQTVRRIEENDRDTLTRMRGKLAYRA